MEVLLQVLDDLANLLDLRKLKLDLQGAGLPLRLTHYPLSWSLPPVVPVSLEKRLRPRTPLVLQLVPLVDWES